MDTSKLNAPYEITSIDPWLAPHAGDIELRMNRFKGKRWQLVGGAETLTDFANGYLYFGFHRTESGWVFRESRRRRTDIRSPCSCRQRFSRCSITRRSRRECAELPSRSI